MLILNSPEYQGVKKIISGGQCGADYGGLLAAEILGIETGGFAPLGFRTYFGNNLKLKTRFNLEETESFGYKQRTIKNVSNSDGTVIIGTNLFSPGCELTGRSARRLNKHCFFIPIDEFTNLNLAAISLKDWLILKEISTLNVAGNRDKTGNLLESCTQIIITEAIILLNKYLYEPV